MDAWERIYSKSDFKTDMMYSPFNKFGEDDSFGPHEKIQQDQPGSDLVSKFTLPDSSYGSDLPRLTDLSKSTLAMKNIQIFERYIVGEIFNYCKSNYREHEYLNSLSQIRYHLASGDIK